MSRRRLRLHCSSDEEDEAQPRQPAPAVPFQPPPLSNSSAAVEISDDDEDFIDVSDTLSPPSPLPPVSGESSRPAPAAPVSSASMAVDCPISEFLGQMGLRLKREWLDGCITDLEGSVPAFSSLDVATKAKLCFEQFLLSDMNHSGGGVLPQNVDSLHLVDLTGPFIVQVDEIVNISCPLRGRYQTVAAGPKRCLKLSMTDGVQRVSGLEYRPIKELEALAPAGLKVAICNVHVRRGLLMLVPEALEVIGGVVDEPEAARERVVHEVNKPPRGRRTRSEVVPPLATRATLSAWATENGNDARPAGSTTDSRTISPPGAPGVPPEPSGVSTSLRASTESTIHASRRTSIYSASSNIIADFEEMHMDHAAPTTNTADAAPQNIEEVNEHPDSVSSRANDLHGVAAAVDEMHSESVQVAQPAPDDLLDDDDDEIMDEVDHHPLILRGDKEIPFTYLASLSAKWASMKEKASSVQGKIKCFLTGVKGFQYKQRTTYDLRVYVDDGSLISEIFVDHSVVERGIGHNPEEVTAALSSSDKKTVSSMKEMLKQFQLFLVNFEGIMQIEYRDTSPIIPVAMEMIEGCAASDAWLLLRRVKYSSTTPRRAHAPGGPSSTTIHISP